VPRLAAIGYPECRLFGQPGDAAGQTAVLQATLQALVNSRTPGEVTCLPFEWQGDTTHTHPPETPPIVKLIQRQPWLLPRLLKREPPE
jgi:hypothetical protein